MVVSTRHIPHPTTAGNPIAKMLAKQKLQRSLIKMKILLWWAKDGTPMQQEIQEISRLIVIALMACRMDKVKDYNSEMDEALKHLCSIAENEFKWDSAGLVSIDDAMDAVVLVTPKLSARAFQKSTQEVDRLIKEERKNDTTNTATA